MPQALNIGLIGLGFIGKVHVTAYRDMGICLSRPQVTANLAAVLRSRLDSEPEAMQAAGFQQATTNPDEFFAAPLDIVDICSPNHLHFEQVKRALEQGLNTYCEKPLTCTLSEARALAEIAKKSGAKTHMAFVFRYVPAVRQMKALIAAGALGEIFHFRAQMLHGSYLDPNRPMSWRLRKAQSGGGAFMDLGGHLVDLTRYLLGEAAAVRASTRTLIHERPSAPGSAQHETVDVDDWTMCTLEMRSGAVGTLEVSRMAAGAGEATRMEIFGSCGALSFDFRTPDTINWYDLKRKQWITGAPDVPPVAGERPIDQVWPSAKYSQGNMTNAHLASAYDFMLDVAGKGPSIGTLEDGVAAQEIVEAAYLSGQNGSSTVQLPL